MESSEGRCARINCFRPADVVVSGVAMSRRRSDIEAENRTVRRRTGVSDSGSGERLGVECVACDITFFSKGGISLNLFIPLFPSSFAANVSDRELYVVAAR